jgi:hypothetical protein
MMNDRAFSRHGAVELGSIDVERGPEVLQSRFDTSDSATPLQG